MFIQLVSILAVTENDCRITFLDLYKMIRNVHLTATDSFELPHAHKTKTNRIREVMKRIASIEFKMISLCTWECKTSRI